MKRISALLMTVGLSALLLSTLLVHSQGPSQGQDTSASKFRRSEKPIHGEYIVVLKESVARGNVDAVTTELATRHGGTTRFIYKDAIRGFSVRMPEAAALALSHDPRVSFVEENGEGSAATVQGPPTPWALDRIDQAGPVGSVNDVPGSGVPPGSTFGTSEGTYTYNNTGAGVDVYVIDSGIRVTHEEFEGRASLQRGYLSDGSLGPPLDYVGYTDPGFGPGEDCYGHGTNVAGVIGGKTYGVAKGVRLISLRVLDCAGGGATDRYIAAINDVIGLGTIGARRIINMSVGAGASLAVNDAVDNAEGYGILVVVAAGNIRNGEGVDVSTVSPASASVPLTVSGTNWTDVRSGNDLRLNTVLGFNYGSGVDLFAPGFRVKTANPFNAAGAQSDTSTAQGIGTSFAAPVVAGIAAMYLENCAPTYPRFVSQIIKSNATIGKVVDAGSGSPNRMAYSILSSSMNNPIDNAGFFVWRQYLDFYGCTTVPVDPNDPGGVKEYIFRAPNDTELSSDREQITSCGSDSTCIGNARVAVARARWDSAEFQQQPAVIADGLVTGIGSFNHHQFVRYCYLKYLQREPDPEGWAYWEGQLNLDNDYNHIIRAFISCPDYYGRFDASVNSLNTCGS